VVWLQMQAKVVYNGTAVFGSITSECLAAATLTSMTDVSSVVFKFKVDFKYFFMAAVFWYYFPTQKSGCNCRQNWCTMAQQSLVLSQ
jgi:hypothetical protein